MDRALIFKVSVVMFFIGLLLTPSIIRLYNQRYISSTFSDKATSIERYGFFLEDITIESGISFEHKRSQLDMKLEHILPQIASMGASVSVSDVNNDGYPDIYLTNSLYGSMNALYINQGDGKFIERAVEMGVADVNREGTGVSMGAIWADVNNNGFEDLLVYKWGKPELFLNIDGSQFVSAGEQIGFPNWINANTAVWLDYNRDGLIDLFIGGYFHESVDFWNLSTTQIMPDSYEYATNGGRNFLFKNNGDGTFRDVTLEVGLLETNKWTLAAASADLTGNGFPDLIIANDYGTDEIFLNYDGNTFHDASVEMEVGFIPKSGMSVSVGDVLNTGQFSIYITNISEAGVLMQGNNLWVPHRSSENSNLRYRNLARNMGVDIGDWGYSGLFMDYNNDGNLDLYVANGFISGTPGTDYWYDYSRIVGANRNIIMDAINWPAMNGRTLSGYQNNKIWVNDGSGRFIEVAAAVGGLTNLDSRSVAYADLFQKGSLDLIVANQDGPAKIYKNTTDINNNWIAFDLTGSQSNLKAIGATILIESTDNYQHIKTVSGGEAFSSQSQRPVHFGIGRRPEILKATIMWPSGQRQEIFSPELNRTHKILEPSTTD